MEAKDVVVVGGGLAGLAAAAYAARAGASVRVIERSGQPGGRARTRDQDGFLFNVGPHALYRRGAARAALRELGVAMEATAPPSAGLALRGDAAHVLPATPASLLGTRLLSARSKLQVARLLARLRRGAPAAAPGASFEDWLRDRRLRADAADLLRALARVTTYAHAPARLDAAAALRQLHLAVTGSVLYLDGGWQTLVDGLRRAAETAGAQVVTGQRVERLETDMRGIVGVRSADGVLHAARAVVLAVPPGEADLLAGPLSAHVRSAAAAAVPVRAACLDLGLSALPRPDVTFALGIDRPWYLSVHSATARLAPRGKVLLHAARYLGDDHPPAADVERELEQLMERVQPGWRRHVEVRRFVPELVVAGDLVRAGASRPRVAVPDVAGLFLAGDWIGAEGMLADASLASARAAATEAVRGLQERAA